MILVYSRGLINLFIKWDEWHKGANYKKIDKNISDEGTEMQADIVCSMERIKANMAEE